MHYEITLLYLGAKYFIYMFRVWGLNMLMFASRIVGGIEEVTSATVDFPKQTSLCIALAAVSAGGAQ